MRYNYINPKNNKEARIQEFRNDYGQTFYDVYFEQRYFTKGSFEDAETIMTTNGYVRKGFTDDMGVTRHAMARQQVENLYKRLDDFIADCTFDEYKAHEQAFTAIKTLLHQRMQ